jgi:hypothetical protein
MGELGAQLGSIIALLHAFQVQVPVTAALVIFCLLAMASVVPSLPGGLGFNQAAVVAPLGSVYGVAAPGALAFSLGMQATGLAVALLGGVVAVLAERLPGRASGTGPATITPQRSLEGAAAHRGDLGRPLARLAMRVMASRNGGPRWSPYAKPRRWTRAGRAALPSS